MFASKILRNLSKCLFHSFKSLLFVSKIGFLEKNGDFHIFIFDLLAILVQKEMTLNHYIPSRLRQANKCFSGVQTLSFLFLYKL